MSPSWESLNAAASKARTDVEDRRKDLLAAARDLDPEPSAEQLEALSYALYRLVVDVDTLTALQQQLTATNAAVERLRAQQSTGRAAALVATGVLVGALVAVGAFMLGAAA